MQNVENLVIIGSGPAGLTAGIYSARSNLNPILIAGENFGGQLMLTTEVENYPGFPDGVMGPKLMMDMIKQAEKFGTKMVYKYVTSVDFSSTPFKIQIGEEQIFAKSVIIATGAKPKWLGLENEMKLVGRGVSTCATCDAAFYKGKKVAVVGGGDTAMEEASHLSKFASEVVIIHRRDTFRASKAMQERVFGIKNISYIWESEVLNYLEKDSNGEKILGGIQIKNLKSNTLSELTIDGIFLAIGHEPQTSIFNGIEKNEMGYIKPTAESIVKTNVEGVFVCGDAEDYKYRQAIVAAGSGCMAAIEAEHYLNTLKSL